MRPWAVCSCRIADQAVINTSPADDRPEALGGGHACLRPGTDSSLAECESSMEEQGAFGSLRSSPARHRGVPRPGRSADLHSSICHIFAFSFTIQPGLGLTGNAGGIGRARRTGSEAGGALCDMAHGLIVLAGAGISHRSTTIGREKDTKKCILD